MGSLPDLYYFTHPVLATGAETEGGAAVLTVDTATTVPVVVLGHGSATWIESPDLQALAAALPRRGIALALITQPYRLGRTRGRGSDEASLDIAWRSVWPHVARPGLPMIAGAAMGIGAMAVAMLGLPMTSVLLPALLFPSDALALTPLVILAVVLTTGGGLYRYQLRDEVEVVGFFRRCPLLRFLGKSDRVSDLVGEKLAEAHVQGVLDRLLAAAELQPRFALLVPVFGMTASALLMNEPLQPWKLLAAALVMSGQALNLAWPRLRAAWLRT